MNKVLVKFLLDRVKSTGKGREDENSYLTFLVCFKKKREADRVLEELCKEREARFSVEGMHFGRAS